MERRKRVLALSSHLHLFSPLYSWNFDTVKRIINCLSLKLLNNLFGIWMWSRSRLSKKLWSAKAAATWSPRQNKASLTFILLSVWQSSLNPPPVSRDQTTWLLPDKRDRGESSVEPKRPLVVPSDYYIYGAGLFLFLFFRTSAV